MNFILANQIFLRKLTKQFKPLSPPFSGGEDEKYMRKIKFNSIDMIWKNLNKPSWSMLAVLGFYFLLIADSFSGWKKEVSFWLCIFFWGARLFWIIQEKNDEKI